jgi:glyoxylase-like metal-dependent hydrolase (beta-lactamase superfamily II)
VSRALDLTATARWWPSVLWQTTTLTLDGNGARLLVDPGIATWETREAAADGATHILITHADWDHVMGIGLLPDAQVWASQSAAERIRSGEARASVETETRPFGVVLEGLDGMRVDEVVPANGEPYQLGTWRAESHATPGHTPDGITTWIEEAGLLIVGDHLSQHEIPFIYDSAWKYRSTLALLTELIERHRPSHVVVGHGRPHAPERALEIAAQDAAYVDALIAFAEAGGTPDRAEDVPFPDRGGHDDPGEHRSNLELVCAQAAA